MNLLPCYAVVDLETTGGHGANDRITEIALVRVENGHTTARWSSLVNPERSIPPFIQSLTGINDAMVADAPLFERIAPQVRSLLQGAVFVAHNARFDQGFLTQELQRCGLGWDWPVLCTVRLSRKLYPQHKSHGLDAIATRHGLHNAARHRAMGDVDVVLQWLALAETELGADKLRSTAQALLQGSAGLPAHVQTPLSALPPGPGAYLLRDAQGQALYAGKASHLRPRILKHFQTASSTAQERQLAQQTASIECFPGTGELHALIHCAQLVAQWQPTHNALRKRERATLEFTLSTLPPWPLPQALAIREYHAPTQRGAVHVFDQWRCLGSVHNEADWDGLDLDRERAAQRPFDLELFRVLQRRIPTLRHDPQVQLLKDLRHG